MKKIVYLFGAGASRQALPIVEEMPERFNTLVEELESEEFQLSEEEIYDDAKNYLKDNKRTLQEVLIRDLKWLKEESSNSASIDTLAKRFYITGDSNSLTTLKLALSVFFICEQAGKPPGKRYDAFYASLLNHHDTDFPDHIRILSWNYDSQFELAHMAYSKITDFRSSASRLNIVSKYHTITGFNKDAFSIYKLNGSTVLKKPYDQGNYHFLGSLNGPLTKEAIDTITYFYSLAKNFPDNIYPCLSFAWEGQNDNDKLNIVKKAIDATRDAEVLVVIGYSFPFFNRSIDRDIIGKMQDLHKVYFQSPEAEALVERFKAVSDKANLKNDIGLVPISRDLKQFYLPNEL